MPLDVTHFSDPACPWAYSVSPAHAVLRWRYADGLRWRLVTIGLTEHASQYVARGHTPERSALTAQRFRAYGMPFGAGIKQRVAGTSRACRTIVATRLKDPAREFEVFRALQLMQFTTTRLLDDDDDLEATLSALPGVDGGAIVGAIEDPDVIEAYERDRAESRTAAGSPTEFQGKAGQTDGPVRYTAPSVIFALGDRRLEAGGFQTVEAYDVLIANLDPTLDRRPAAGPDDVPEVLDAFPEGLTTTEVAAIMTAGNDAPHRDAAERALVALAAAGGARREPVGDGVLWQPAHARVPATAAA